MTERTKCGKNKGFTLLEVLVALAIVAVAALGILVLNNDLFRLMGNARSMDSLALLACDVAYKHSAEMRGKINEEGECDPPYSDCRWSIRTESTDEPGLALMRLTVECGSDKSITIESIVQVSEGAR